MDDQRITAEELRGQLQGDLKVLAEAMAAAINKARIGRIIDDSEEPVRDAHAVFRQKAYQRALDLLQKKALQEDFSPRKTQPQVTWSNKGPQKTSCHTVNGPVEFTRTIYWNKERGTVAPLDELLGIVRQSYSAGVREIVCRLCLNDPFVPASENLLRTAQLDISHSVVRELAEAEGRRAYSALAQERLSPGWTAADCTEGTLISGLDGVTVPTVTEKQKQERRAAEATKRQKEGRKSTAKAGRPRKGADGPFKEFKVLTFYDPDKRHLFTLGTAGECHEAGARMRREALRLGIGQARHKYSVSDGAPWIARQYATQLPMLEANILDYYHLRDQVIGASQVLHGEGTAPSVAWREEMMGYVWNQGSLVMLDHLANYIRRHRSGPKAEALKALRAYVAPRVNMTDYPSYRQLGYDCGSGPTESCCGTLTRRLKGRGMRWDRDNAESMMALAGLYQSRLWSDYWAQQRAA